MPDEQGPGQFLANEIVALGGEPATPKHAQQAEEFGDTGLVVQLEDLEDMILRRDGAFGRGGAASSRLAFVSNWPCVYVIKTPNKKK